MMLVSIENNFPKPLAHRRTLSSSKQPLFRSITIESAIENYA